VPAKRKKRDTSTTQPASVLLRLSPDVLVALDAWLDQINAARKWPGLSRSELLRRIVERAVAQRWGGPAPDE
jgi:hypothetical protein